MLSVSQLARCKIAHNMHPNPSAQKIQISFHLPSLKILTYEFFFVQEPHGGFFRSLIQTSPTGCHLPPLTLITVHDIHEAGMWEAEPGVLSQRKCFTVKVAFAL